MPLVLFVTSYNWRLYNNLLIYSLFTRFFFGYQRLLICSGLTLFEFDVISSYVLLLDICFQIIYKLIYVFFGIYFLYTCIHIVWEN